MSKALSADRGPNDARTPAQPSETSTLTRAFELARSGLVPSLLALRIKLAEEGHVVSWIDGPALGRKLRNRIDDAHSA